jgi:hypothetical protein
MTELLAATATANPDIVIPKTYLEYTTRCAACWRWPAATGLLAGSL